jgi:hypothetical protein
MNYLHDTETLEDYDLLGIDLNMILVKNKLIRLPFDVKCLILHSVERDKYSIKNYFILDKTKIQNMYKEEYVI